MLGECANFWFLIHHLTVLRLRGKGRRKEPGLWGQLDTFARGCGSGWQEPGPPPPRMRTVLWVPEALQGGQGAGWPGWADVLVAVRAMPRVISQVEFTGGNILARGPSPQARGPSPQARRPHRPAGPTPEPRPADQQL